MKNRLQGYKQKVLKKQALTFEFDIVPCSVADIPAQVAKVSCVWQRGSKLQYTNAAPVDTERKAYWNQVLKVTATLYKDANKILPKEYVLKVQSVQSDDIRGKRTTIGKCEINLADYCALGTGSTDVPVRLRPYGTVQLSITATHMANSKPEQDGMSDVSFMSSVGRQSMGSAASSSLLDTDQDLDGFDEEADRRQQATADAGNRGRSPFKQGRSQAELGPGPLASGLTGSGGSGGSNAGGGIPALRRAPAATTNLQHAASTPTHIQTSKANPFKVQDNNIARAASAALETTGRNGSADAQTPEIEGASSPFARDPGGDVFFTPDLPPRSTKRNPVRHKRSSSSPLNLPVDIPEHSDGDHSPAFAEAHEYDRVIKESYATLKSSDDEDESAGIVRSVKSWWGGGSKIKQPPKPDPNESPYGRPDPALQSATNLVPSSDQECEAVMKENDVQALQQKCRQLLRQRDADRLTRRQDLHHLERLQAQCESLGRAKAMMTERLAVAEAKLLKISHDDAVQTLVETKLTLAQSEFQTLELQGQLKEEKARSSNLLARLSAMEADCLATSNIDLT